MSWVNLHAHNMWSFYDGYGKAAEHVARVRDLGQSAAAITNHGNISGWVEHDKACKEIGVKPIFGVEGYYQPQFKPKDNRYHLIVLAQNTTGLHNLMKLISESNRERFYINPYIDMQSLMDYSDGLIVLSGCISGILARNILGGHRDKAVVIAKAFQRMLGDRFYIEVQPNDMDSQKIANRGLLSIADELDIEPVLTLDSHYMHPDDYETYMVMHKIANNRNPEADYSDKYLTSEEDVRERWFDTMGVRYSRNDIFDNAGVIADRCDAEIGFSESVPRIDWGMSSRRKLKEVAVAGLNDKVARVTKHYQERLKSEIEVVFSKGFEDYFLLCYDIVEYAHKVNIAIGFGRGSVCGSLLAFCMGLTNVDPIIMGTSFERFLRPDKMSLPDIDIDFDSSRRDEIIRYIVQEHDGKAAPVAAFGYYRDTNLSNDLGKMYGMDKDVLGVAQKELLIYDSVKAARSGSHYLKQVNKKYPGFLKHFFGLKGQIRYVGKHASGVAVCVNDVDSDAGVFRIRGEIRTTFDLESLGSLGVVKIDALSLDAVTIMNEIEQNTGASFSYDILDDDVVFDEFCKANTVGVFQFEKYGAKEILRKVAPSNIQELIACTALNRPAPLKLGIVDDFINAKNSGNVSQEIWSAYTQDTYGTIVYQEHVMAICRGMANLDWPDVDKVMKNLRQSTRSGVDELERKFVKGATRNGIPGSDAHDLYKKMTLYLFNKGHGAGYTLLSFYMMWLKVYYPLQFYHAIIGNEHDDYKRDIYRASAVRDGIVVMMPHVNGKANCDVVTLDGSSAIREGMLSIKGVGAKAAEEIERQSPFKNEQDLLDRVPKRLVNSRVVTALKEAGALEFNDKKYYRRVTQYNTALWARHARIW